MKLLDAMGKKLVPPPKKKSWFGGLFEQDESEEDYLKF
jgi:hypothetical protein